MSGERWGRRGRRALRGTVAAALLLGVVAAPAAAQQPSPPTLILISLDGFAARLFDPALAPTLARLAAGGVHAPDGMVPVFPTKTFPSHYSIVTGLHPERHGIVANTMYDPAFDAWFRITDRAAVRDTRWWGGEPLWVTAERQGRTAAPFFWVGSEAEIGGTWATYWRPFDDGVSHRERVTQILAWLDLPPPERPAFLTLYFSDVDTELHRHGVESPEGRAAIRRVDAAIGELVAGLEVRGLYDAVNLVIVADHGMADTSPERVIFLDDYIDLAGVRVSDWTPVAAVWPLDGDGEAIYRALTAASAPWVVYRKAEMPDRLHYRDHRRIAPIIAVADEGWSIARRRGFRPERFVGATHGYDNALPSMRALFLARGPAFRRGLTVAPFQSVHLYELMAAVLRLEPAPNDGSLDSVRVMMR